MSARPALAVSLYVADRRCLVVGDGPSAAERVRRLRDAGADVSSLPAAAYRAEILRGVFMVCCCDATAAARVSRDARAQGVLIYCHDAPERSDFAFPALARRGPLQIAVSTDGTAPALARRLREELERLLAEAAPALDALLADLGRLREELPPDRRDELYDRARSLQLKGSIIVG